MTPPELTDHLVMEMWDGQPTLYFQVIDGLPVLSWLVLGHTEEFDVWLDIQLTWREADEFIADPPQRLDLYVNSRTNRQVKLWYRSPDRQWSAAVDWIVPQGGFNLGKVVRTVQERLRQLEKLARRDGDTVEQQRAGAAVRQLEFAA